MGVNIEVRIESMTSERIIMSVNRNKSFAVPLSIDMEDFINSIAEHLKQDINDRTLKFSYEENMIEFSVSEVENMEFLSIVNKITNLKKI